MGILCKARKFLGRETLKMLYHSLIYPHLIYCIEVWGNAADTYLDSLQKLQNRIVRIITSVPFREGTNPIFKALKILKISEVYELCVLTFMFRFAKRELPLSTKSMFQWIYEINSRVTRNSNKLYIPTCKTTLYYNSIKFQGVKRWNSITENFETNCCIHTLKENF